LIDKSKSTNSYDLDDSFPLSVVIFDILLIDSGALLVSLVIFDILLIDSGALPVVVVVEFGIGEFSANTYEIIPIKRDATRIIYTVDIILSLFIYH
jgi:hypothetical protein